MLDKTTLKIDDVYFSPNACVISWTASIGYGEYTLINEDGKLIGQSESMDCNEDKTFLKTLLEKLVEEVEIVC